MVTDYTANEALWNQICQNEVTFEKMSQDLKVILARMMCRDPSLRIRAKDCLCTNSKLQNIAGELGLDAVGEDSSEEMVEAELLDNFDEQENEDYEVEKIEPMTDSKKVLDPVRKKLF